MFARISKLWRLISYFIHARKSWHWPRRSEVLIYDAAGQYLLLEYLKPWTPEVLHVRGERINVWVLVASLFRSGRKSDAYVDCYIKHVRPRLVVTFIDNNPEFYLLAQRHPGIRTLFIQNACRARCCDVFEILERARSPADCGEVHQMLTFGRRIGTEYAKHVRGAVVPVGSLKNNLFPRKQAKKSGCIAFISQYRDTEGFVVDGNFLTRETLFEQSDRLVLSFLLEYAKTRGKELYIVPCTGHYANGELAAKERAYFRQLTGKDCAFSEWTWLGSSYDAVDSAEVAVGVDSTLGYESAARGNKTAFFSVRTRLLGVESLTFGWPENYPDEGPFWTNEPDAGAFAQIMDHLFAIDEMQWQSELAQHRFSDLIAYDPGNSVLQTILRSELGTGPVSRGAAAHAAGV